MTRSTLHPPAAVRDDVEQILSHVFASIEQVENRSSTPCLFVEQGNRR
jgi:hypothetical protein